MVLGVEPMVTAGRQAVRMGDDHWAIYSQDGSLAAHFEFTIAITADGPRVLPRGTRRAARGGIEPCTAFDLCYSSASRSESPDSVWVNPRRGSGGRSDGQSPADGNKPKGTNEGTTLGQAHVRKVQDHPAPWRPSS